MEDSPLEFRLSTVQFDCNDDRFDGIPQQNIENDYDKYLGCTNAGKSIRYAMM